VSHEVSSIEAHLWAIKSIGNLEEEQVN